MKGSFDWLNILPICTLIVCVFFYKVSSTLQELPLLGMDLNSNELLELFFAHEKKRHTTFLRSFLGPNPIVYHKFLQKDLALLAKIPCFCSLFILGLVTHETDPFGAASLVFSEVFFPKLTGIMVNVGVTISK